MCYGAEAQPPDHGRHGAVSAEEDLILTSADGTAFSARLARPAQPNGTGVVVMPDVRGLHMFYCALTRLFAEAGVEAIAMDYFGRSDGLVDGRPDDFEYMPHIKELSFDDVARDCAAAIAHLRGLGTVERVFTLGFCYGGAMSWRQSADQEGLAGSIGFYGVPSRVMDKVPQMKAPLLMLLGGADQASTPEQFEEMRQALKNAGVAFNDMTYAGAPHSFFDRGYDEWKDACADSWQQIFSFMEMPPTA